jgi:DNA invertase Pin-like site-specific DNA recombinase
VLVSGERDEGISGTAPLDERPGLARALARLEDGAAEALVVYRLDRLARDILVQETVVRRLEAKGRQVISATEPDITTSAEDPTREFLRGLLGLIAAYERAVIRGRLASARRLKAERGEYAGGRPPFGYAAASGTLIPVPEEQRVLRRIAELRREGCSLERICARLAEEGLKPRYAERWHPWQISKLLRRVSA